MYSIKDDLDNNIFFCVSEFHDGTCIDAYDIIFNLCQWIKIYFYEDNMIVLESSN